MTRVALPLDERGQIAGQLDVFDVLGDIEAQGAPQAVGGAPKVMVALTAIQRSKNDHSALGSFGVDTVGYRFRPASQAVFDGLLHQPHRSIGGAAVLNEKPAGIVVSVYPGVVRVEGRLDPLLTGCRDTFDLRPGSDVRRGEVVARSIIEELASAPLDGGRGHCHDAEIARLDLAHEFEFEDPSHGLAFLRTLAAMHPPRRKTKVITADDGTVQTVYYGTPKTLAVRERAYDKGVESGSHAAGLRVRFEAQRRFQKGQAISARSGFSGRVCGELYGSAAVGYTRSETVAVGRPHAEQQLLGAHARGELSIAKAERMLGTLAVLDGYGRGIYAGQQGRRRLAELRRYGVSPESAVGPDRIVPVGRLLKESMESWAAADD